MHLRRRTTAGLATGLVALATFGAALPAGAADTEVQFTVEADSTALSVAVGSATATVDNAGSNAVIDSLTGDTLVDTLPTVTVTDKRGQLLAGWTLTVGGEDFVSTTDAGETVAASNVRIYNDVVDAAALTLEATLAGMTLTGGEFAADTGNDLAAAYTLLAGSTTAGDGSAVITPTASVTIPAGTQAGTYTGTVTYTAS